MSRLHHLAESWRADANKFKEWGDERPAHILLRVADQLASAIEQADEEPLSLASAATASGYSPSHIGRLIRTGTIPNAGRPNAPAVRRRDLPVKAGHLTLSHTAAHVHVGRRERIVRSVVNSK